MNSIFDRPDDNVYKVPDDGGTHLSHIGAPLATIGDATGLVYCKACGTLLRSDNGPARGHRAYQPCRPVKVELRDRHRVTIRLSIIWGGPNEDEFIPHKWIGTCTCGWLCASWSLDRAWQASYDPVWEAEGNSVVGGTLPMALEHVKKNDKRSTKPYDPS